MFRGGILAVSGFVRHKFFVWRFLDNVERQCGLLLALCGLYCHTDACHLRQDGLRWEEEFYTAMGPLSLSVHTRTFFFLTCAKTKSKKIIFPLLQNHLMYQQ